MACERSKGRSLIGTSWKGHATPTFPPTAHIRTTGRKLSLNTIISFQGLLHCPCLPPTYHCWDPWNYRQFCVHCLQDIILPEPNWHGLQTRKTYCRHVENTSSLGDLLVSRLCYSVNGKFFFTFSFVLYLLEKKKHQFGSELRSLKSRISDSAREIVYCGWKWIVTLTQKYVHNYRGHLLVAHQSKHCTDEPVNVLSQLAFFELWLMFSPASRRGWM